MQFTKANIADLKLPEGKDDHIWWDNLITGLGVRLRKGGSASFVFQYSIGTKTRRMSLGKVQAIPIAKVRDLAAQLCLEVRAGKDPAHAKVEARRAATETFAYCAERYLRDARERLRPRSYVEVERHLLKNAKPLHPLSAAKITRREIATLINKVSEERGRVTANRVQTAIGGLYSYALQQGLVEENPTIGGPAPHREKPRDRVLSMAELKLVWNAAGDDDFSAIVRLLMLTGQRAKEISALRWSEIKDAAIELPGERTKNHRSHTIPLSAPAAAILAAQHRSPGRDFVFGRGANGWANWSVAKADLDSRITEASGGPIKPWVLHDLRRSAATHMAEIGVQPHIIEAVLNHVSGHKAGVAGIYNRASYSAEKCTALNLWAEHLMAAVEGRESNVVELKRA